MVILHWDFSCGAFDLSPLRPLILTSFPGSASIARACVYLGLHNRHFGALQAYEQSVWLVGLSLLP